MQCDSPTDYTYDAQFVIRSSPCDKEFYDVMSAPESRVFLESYFVHPDTMVGELLYSEFLYYKSEVTTFSCHHGSKKGMLLKAEENYTMNLITINKKPAVQQAKKRKKGEAADAPVSIKTKRETHRSKASDDVSIVLDDVDAIYLVLVKIEKVKPFPAQAQNLTVEVRWRGPQGFLGAIDWPLFPFYGTMCGVYGIYALAWLIVSACQWKDLLRVQFWIGAVILLGMVEKAVFYAECQSLNYTGVSVEGAIQLAELVSCLKRTLARMLVIVVSVGFGVVKPRLGSTLHKVVGVGFVYFVLCAIEGITRVSKAQPEAAKQKQLVGLPLTLLEVAIFWWIFTSLVNTMRALRLRRNEVKLGLYRHFTNTLIFAVLASVCFMVWSLAMHTFTSCLKDWKELWVDVAFWHLLFSVILLVIMILWRPTNNNQRYAFTPLLDSAEDEEDGDDTLFSEAFTTAEATKIRAFTSSTKAENRKDRAKDIEVSLEEELKWVEEHIPSSLADKTLPALVDSDEEAQQAKFEISKMQ